MVEEVNTPDEDCESSSTDPSEEVDPSAGCDDAPAAAPARGSARRTDAIRGELTRMRSGPVRVILLMTGMAAFVWLFRAGLRLMGLRHPVTLALGAGALELRGGRRFMGMSLGRLRHVAPLSGVKLITVQGASATWAIVAALAVLVIAAAIGAMLITWGVAGRQPSWIVMGLAVIGLGVLLDAGAYLLVNWSRGRRLASLVFRSSRYDLRLSKVPLQDAEAFVEHLKKKGLDGWNS